jgi:hypothetical protein
VVTAHALTVAGGADVALEVGELVAALVQPLASIPTASAVPAAAHGSRRRELRACFGSVMSAPSGSSSEGDADQVQDYEEQRPDDSHRDENGSISAITVPIPDRL